MTAILGISAFYHDSAAALVRDGTIVAAAQEERFSRRKHDSAFPKHAIAYCLTEAGLSAADLDAVAFYEKPLVKFERLLETYLRHAPRGFRSFLRAMPAWLGTKLFIPRHIDRGLDDAYDGPIHFARHHESHAASAFFPSPFERAAVLTMDGVGEWSTTTWGIGEGNRVRLHGEVRFPHSIGLLYSAVTYYLGFRVNSGEHKVMGLAPYGEPRFRDAFAALLRFCDDGSFWLDQRYFDYSAGLTMTSRRFHQLFGGPPRRPESELEQRHKDIAASVQAVVEEAVARAAAFVHAETGCRNLCLAGGVALNCVANGKLLREGPFDELWIQPAAGDAGGALGCALLSWHHVLGNPRVPARPDGQHGTLLGPAFSPAQVERELDAAGAVYTVHDHAELCRRVAGLLDAGKVVGHFAGRAEFGPRALGNRSILADARNPDVHRLINDKIKFRESFRPFAPSVLAERVADYFELDRPSPYMLLVAPVKADVRASIPAVTHVDRSARIQTVDRAGNPRYYGIIAAFEEQTGCAVIVNTSFNIRGEPIVATPTEAYRCFMFTDMDALVVENAICLKPDQPLLTGADVYRAGFELD